MYLTFTSDICKYVDDEDLKSTLKQLASNTKAEFAKEFRRLKKTKHVIETASLA
jgi:DNA-binding TFAR19-related protein (PDSD5 family)